MINSPNHDVLLTGATGHVGRNLLPRLVAEGWRVRCMTRRPREATIDAGCSVKVVQGDALDPESLASAIAGCRIAYYLIHSMSQHGNFQEKDRRAAENFARVAAEHGVERIIYLGGLGRETDRLSPHLNSRQETGRILRSGPVPTIEFRAAMVIGRGSLSFETVRNLCKRLPVMICPRWLQTETQPISTSDLVEYLAQAASEKTAKSKVIEIGCSDQTTYSQIIREFARQNGMRRLLIPVPLLTPQLSRLWLRLVTPETAAVTRDLIAGLTNPTIVTDDSASMFNIETCDVATAIERALAEYQ